MKLVFIIGDSAVGKMTVGQELMKLTGLRLFHNHMAIEPVLDIFGDYDTEVVQKLGLVIFEKFVKTDYPGLIFTIMWAFNEQSDWDYVEQIKLIFKGSEIYYVELYAPQEIRLQRNITENRLKYKPSKRDIGSSNERIINDDKRYRCVSEEGEVPFENYIKIDNSERSAESVALEIKERFHL